MRSGLIKEAAVAGGALLVVTTALMYAARAAGVESKLPLPVWVVLAGATTHLAFEAVGGNAKFVQNYLHA